MDNFKNITKNYDVMVCVSGRTNLRLLTFLKSGFKHCFALIKDHDSPHWIYCDPLIPRLEMRLIAEDQIAAFLVTLINSNHRIMPAEACKAPPRLTGLHRLYWQLIAPFRLYHCVRLILEILGRPNLLILTPYKLCNYILRQYDL